jgi:hypothetical protein
LIDLLFELTEVQPPIEPRFNGNYVISFTMRTHTLRPKRSNHWEADGTDCATAARKGIMIFARSELITLKKSFVVPTS